eukprot:g19425.t1
MRAASAERWAEDELFNLKNAFDLQLKRLEVDWAEHGAKVGVEYEARRAMLQARAGMEHTSGAIGGAPPSLALEKNDPSSTPWRSREKQSRLIHTAPVFEPKSGRASSVGTRGASSSGMGRSRGGHWVRGAEEELKRLDEAFVSVGDQVRAQKEAAQKWIRRQRIRMEVCMNVFETIEDETCW